MSLKLDQVLHTLYEFKEGEYKTFCSNQEGPSLFYHYISNKFEEYLGIIKDINEEEIESVLFISCEFKGSNTKLRFINLSKSICYHILLILKNLYSPNHVQSLIDLERLLDGRNKDLKRYLNDMYINYFRYDLDNRTIFYRILDWDENQICTNCWHTPYNLREHSSAGRYNIPGYPALYLGNSKDTCLKEVGKTIPKKNRWLGEFILKDKQQLACLDLRMSMAQDIDNLTVYDKFSLLITYPLRFICSVESLHKTEKFCEEYLFSQALVSLLFVPTDIYKTRFTTFCGVVYDSTKLKGGVNYAIYAKPQDYPPSKEESYSHKLKSIFHHDMPLRLFTNENNDKCL